MDWMAIGGAIVLGAMFFFLLPRAKEMLKNSPEASNFIKLATCADRHIRLVAKNSVCTTHR